MTRTKLPLNPEEDMIVFRKIDEFEKAGAYKDMYEIAYRCGERVMNRSGIYLSRIQKRNGKARYYLTKEYLNAYCDGCGRGDCSLRYCRGGIYYDGTYASKYVGKDLDVALAELAKCEHIERPEPKGFSTTYQPVIVDIEEDTEW